VRARKLIPLGVLLLDLFYTLKSQRCVGGVVFVQAALLEGGGGEIVEIFSAVLCSFFVADRQLFFFVGGDWV
jgi:hypothetical protein